MSGIRLTTRRLRLRPARLGDLAFFHAYATTPEVWKPAGFAPPTRVAQTRAKLRGIEAHWRGRGQRLLVFAVDRRKDGRTIGFVGLRWPHAGVAELGYGLLPEHWGRGYGAEAARRVLRLAFEEFDAHRAQATCWVRNVRSAAVLSRLGLSREGRLKGFLRRGREIRDEWMYGVTRAAWRRR